MTTSMLSDLPRLGYLIALCSIARCCYATTPTQRVYVAHSPKLTTFNREFGAISPAQLAQLNAIAVGLDTGVEESSWKPLEPLSSREFAAEASVVVLLEHFEGLDLDFSFQAFPLEEDGSRVNFNTLEERVKEKYPHKSPVVMEFRPECMHSVMDIHCKFPKLFASSDVPVNLRDATKLLKSSQSILHDLSPVKLDVAVAADETFLVEMQIVAEFSRALRHSKQVLKDGTPELMVITLSSIRHVVKHHGLQSPQLHNALTILRRTLNELGRSLEMVYGDNFLYDIATLDGSTEISSAVCESRSPQKCVTDINRRKRFRAGLNMSSEMSEYAFDVVYCDISGCDSPQNPSFTDSAYPVFVTWRSHSNTDDGRTRLRGCQGSDKPRPIHAAIRDTSLSSGFLDKRFEPISKEDLPNLEVQVSILFNFEKGRDYLDFDLENGIQIVFTNHDGVVRKAIYIPGIIEKMGCNRDKAIIKLLRKGKFQGPITKELKKSITLTRFQSEIVSTSYSQYLRSAMFARHKPGF